MLDVLIAGAGPGGVAAAMALRQRAPGLVVRVIDRATFPRDKPCGGGLTGHAAEAMAALGLELDVPVVDAPRGIVRYGDHERAVLLPRPVRVIRRDVFDASLVAQARDAGIDVHEGVALKAIAPDADGVTATTSAGELRARIVIGADGAASVVRKHLGRGGSSALRQAQDRRGAKPPVRTPVPLRLFRAFVPEPAGWAHGDTMIYDFSLLARGLRGYLWLFPAPGGALNVGVMHAPSASSPLTGAQIEGLLHHGLRRFGVTVPASASRGWPAWSYAPGAPVAGPRVLALGDAAGIDGLTGEGIAVAMEHALVAADAVVTGLDRGDLSFSSYRRALRRATVGRELALDGRLASLLYGRAWSFWLPLMLFDPDVLELYAARVAGGLVLADQKARLFGALARHLAALPARQVRLRRIGGL